MYSSEAALVRATFQLVPGLGPTRERRLWDAGLTDWSHASGGTRGLLPEPLGDRLARAADSAAAALAAEDLAGLATLLPTRELWRLYTPFCERAVCLDIETDKEEGITAIGLFDARGPRILLAGRDLERFPEEVPPDRLLITFNGACFDVPVLERAFPGWRAPAAHIDLRPVWTRLGHWGGLKRLEDAVGIGRPDHLRGIDGHAAVWLWRAGQRGDRAALMRFAEYNLYDTVNLRALVVMAHDRLAAATGLPAAPAPRFSRGDVLYDVSKILLAL